MDEENLVKPHPRDEVLVEAIKFREQQELARVAKREKELETARLQKIESEKRRKESRKKNYEESFLVLVGKYLELDKEHRTSYISSLSEAQLKTLEDYVYEKAKKLLWLKKILVVISCLAFPIIGWMVLFTDMFNEHSSEFPSYKFVALRDWYRKEFGQIYSPRPEYVIPNFREFRFD